MSRASSSKFTIPDKGPPIAVQCPDHRKEANMATETGKSKTQNSKSETDVPAHIFREYDIRGIVDKDLTDDVYYNLGRAYGTFLYAQKGIKPVEGERFRVVCGYDARLSGPRFQKSVIKG